MPFQPDFSLPQPQMSQVPEEMFQWNRSSDRSTSHSVQIRGQLFPSNLQRPVRQSLVDIVYSANLLLVNFKSSHSRSKLTAKFTLKVDAKDNLFSVRFMGFETKDVNIEPGKNDYKVVLESDAKQIGEVVVLRISMIQIMIYMKKPKQML